MNDDNNIFEEEKETEIKDELEEKDEVSEEEVIEKIEKPHTVDRKKRNVNLKARLALIAVLICVAGYFVVNNQFTKGLMYNAQNLDENAPVIKLENGFGLNTGIFKNIIAATTRNSIKLYNEKGELIENKGTSEIYGSIPDVTNLAIRTSEDFMLAYDENGKMLYKIDEDGIVFKTKLDYNIVLARPFDNNHFVVVTEDSGSNHQVKVYNENCEEIYIWHSGTGSVVDAALNNRGTKMAIASLEVTDGKIYTKVSLFNLNETMPYNINTFEDNMITGINFNKNVLALGDKYLVHINSSGKITNTYKYENKNLSTYEYLENGSVVLCYEKDSDNVSAVEIISRKGAVKGKYRIDEDVVSLDHHDGSILVSTKTEFSVITSGGMQLRKSQTGKEIKKACFVGKKKIILIGNSEIKISK